MGNCSKMIGDEWLDGRLINKNPPLYRYSRFNLICTGSEFDLHRCLILSVSNCLALTKSI